MEFEGVGWGGGEFKGSGQETREAVCVPTILVLLNKEALKY